MRPRNLVLVAVVVVVVLAAVAAAVLLSGPGKKTVTAMFPQTVNLYPDDDVRIAGVPIGKIDSVDPEGGQVRVTMSFDADKKVSADATAAVVTPTLVGVRYVQFAPAYSGGPELADGAVIPQSRTAVPVEFDEVKQQLNQLAQAVGPSANQLNGPLNRVLDTTSANLAGQGPQLRDTIRQLAGAIGTLSDGRHDLSGTVRNLQVFVSALATSDQQVALFGRQLNQVSQTLDENKTTLAATVSTANRSLDVIRKFIADNRGQLTTDVEGANQVVGNLANNRQALADVLQLAPTAISNFNNIYDEKTSAYAAALATNNLNNPAAFICGVAAGGVPNPNPQQANDAAKFCQTGLGPLLQVLKMNSVPVQVNPVTQAPTGQAKPITPGGLVPGLGPR